MNRVKTWVESITIATLSVVLCIAFLEAGSWLYLRHRARDAGETFEELDPQKMAVYRGMFPDLSDRDIRGLFFTYKQTYEPWVEFRNENLDYPLAHATGLIRRTVPDVSTPVTAPTDVYFFGGSTMQGVHVPDDRTIPSQFVKRAADSPALPVRVVNFGQPYFYLKQEMMLFVDLLLDGKRPAFAIFLDGLNDFHQPGSSVKRTPFFTPAIRWLFDQPATHGVADIARHTNLYRVITGSLANVKLVDTVPSSTIYENYAIPDNVTRDAAFRAVADSYVADVQFITRVCKANGITCLFFLQPVPFLEYDRSGDILAIKGDAPEYASGYATIKARLRSMDNFVSLDDAFVVPAQPPYVDAVHYSPYGTRVLAERIYESVCDRAVPASRCARRTGTTNTLR
jgi:hypothetical protein